MRQLDKVKRAIQQGHTTIQAIFNFTGDIPRPSVRRILGQGAKKGHFTKLDRGIYTLTTESGETRAYIECGLAEQVAPRMAAEGLKFDMLFLDLPYFSRGLVGGNRGIKNYDFIHPEQFAQVMHAAYKMMRTDDSHLYLMLSQAPTVQMDMHKYIFAALETGFQPVAEGRYYKTTKDGKPVTNVTGKRAASERIMLFSRSGKIREGELPLQLEFTVIRPPVGTSYPTQKAEPFIRQLIQQSTFEDEVVGDFFGGSGMTGKCALALNRVVYLIEKLQSAIDNFITPKITEYAL